MRVVPERSPWAQLATILVLMVTGPVVGLGLAVLLTPDSDLVQALSPLAFGVILVVGLLVWMGLGIVAVVIRFVLLVARGGFRRAGAPKSNERLVPPGYRFFPVLGGVLGVGMGLLAGLVTPLSVIAGAGVWTVAGVLYGWVLRMAAHEGYLPFPEPE